MESAMEVSELEKGESSISQKHFSGEALTDDVQISCFQGFRMLGPGIMVCLADTDGPGLIGAAEYGLAFPYSMVLLQVLLYPILFMAQELTVRLGLYCRKGIVEMVRLRFGPVPAYILCTLVLLICLAAIVSQVIVIVQAGELIGCPQWVTGCLVVLILVVVVMSNSYKGVEVVGVLLGSCQLIFVVTMFLAKPVAADVWNGLWDYRPIFNSDKRPSEFFGLVAANIGNVIMPWMLVYQQSAICEKNVLACPAHLRLSRVDTAIGSGITQLVMLSTIITISAVAKKSGRPESKLEDVAHMVEFIQDYVGGPSVAKAFLFCAMVGSSLASSLVVSLCGTWAAVEALGSIRSMRMSVRKAPFYYIGYFLFVSTGAIVGVTVPNDIATRICQYVQTLNGCTMPVILLILFVLASSDLPSCVRLHGWYKWTVCVVFVAISLFTIVAAVLALLP